MKASTILRKPETSPAEVYEARFVPALFGPWAERMVELARLAPGERALDVACGTGALACAAAARVGEAGHVVGLDASADMLAVARRKSDRIDWRLGRAEEIPLPDARFDAVVSQFALMFFDDRALALREMMRVLRRGGRLAVAVCDAAERSPGYAALVALLRRLFGDPVADAFLAPFALGDAEALGALAAEAAIPRARVERHVARVRFESIAALVSTERACIWTLGGMLDDAQFERLSAEAEGVLRPFVGGDGAVAFDMPVLVIVAERG